MSDHRCDCSNRDLLHYGCKCGYFQRVKRDEAIVAKHEADLARARLTELATWWAPMPNAGVMLPNECGTCNHDSGAHGVLNWATGLATACSEPNCACIMWQRKT